MGNNLIKQNIPSEWETKTFGSIGTLIMGQSPKGSSYNINEIGLPLLNGAVDLKKDRIEINQYTSAPVRTSKEGDLLFCIRATIGNLQVSDRVYCLGRGVASMRVDEKYDRKFIAQRLEELFTLMRQRSQGGVIKGLTKDELAGFEILVPKSKIEQQKIAEILGVVDEDIAKTQEVIEATEKLKRGLMQNILSFVNNEGVKYLALGDIGKVSMCKRIFREETSPVGEIPFYKIGTFGKEPDAFISKELYDSYRNKFSFPKIGDVLLSASGTIGRRVKYDGRPAYFQDSNIIWLEHDESKILNNFLFYLYETITWQTEGSTIKRLYNSILLKKIVPVPSIDEQKKIVEILSSVDEKISVNKKLKEKLTFLKKGLMQDLLSGEVRVNL